MTQDRILAIYHRMRCGPHWPNPRTELLDRRNKESCQPGSFDLKLRVFMHLTNIQMVHDGLLTRNAWGVGTNLCHYFNIW